MYTLSLKFKRELKVILEYIAKDKISAMHNFRKELNIQIDNLPNFPYKCRKSYYDESEDTRDMIYNSYVIVYKIYKDHIIIVSIFNQNLPDIT